MEEVDPVEELQSTTTTTISSESTSFMAALATITMVHQELFI